MVPGSLQTLQAGGVGSCQRCHRTERANTWGESPADWWVR